MGLMNFLHLRGWRCWAVAVLAMGQSASAIVYHDIDSAVVDNNGSNVTLDDSPATNYTPSGDSDLLSVTLQGGTTLNTADFLSGVGIDGAQISSDTGFIQRSGLETNGQVLNSGTLQTGSADASTYLSHGARGLSLSTGINYVASRDPQTEITFDATVSNAADLLDGTPDFLFGDVADSHSDDLFQMLDAQGDVILSATLANGQWSDLGNHTIDRVEYNGSGDPFVTDDDTNRGVGLLAFSVEASDLVDNSIAFETQMADVAQFRITIPGSGSQPKTDYAFFGVNINALDVPTAVVPEPGALSLLAGLLMLLHVGVARRPRRD